MQDDLPLCGKYLCLNWLEREIWQRDMLRLGLWIGRRELRMGEILGWATHNL
jgi:hypothetical protein